MNSNLRLLRACLMLLALALAGPLTQGQTPLHIFGGEGEKIGRYIANVGDVNGDGIDDLGFSDLNGKNFLRVHSGADGSLLMNLPGPVPGEPFVRTLAAAGDVNQDGYADIVVGNLSWLQSASQGTVGRFWVISGLDGSVLMTDAGTQQSEKLGATVAGAGDVNQDGYPDVLVSAAGLFECDGFVRVYSGKDGSILHQWDIPAPWHPVLGVGDVDGDGHADIAIGTSGVVQIYSGRTGLLIRELTGQAPPSQFEAFGSALVSVADMDGDGLPELAVAAPSFIPDLGSPVAGAVYVFSLPTGNLLRFIQGPVNGSTIVLLASADVDGDGVADIITGNASHDSNKGIVHVWSGLDSRLLYYIEGKEHNERYGYNAAGLGDWNGDGFEDFAFGAPGEGTLGEGGSGRVRVHSGTCLPATSFCPAEPNSTGAPASIGHQGSLGIAANDLVLTVSGSVPNQFGLFFYGPQPAQQPFGNGTLCVGGGDLGLFRLSVVMADGAGAASLPVDFTQGSFASGLGAATPLSTWHLQFWYRDAAAPGSGFNLSDALRAILCP